jgi:hypothetical protein
MLLVGLEHCEQWRGAAALYPCLYAASRGRLVTSNGAQPLVTKMARNKLDQNGPLLVKTRPYLERKSAAIADEVAHFACNTILLGGPSISNAACLHHEDVRIFLSFIVHHTGPLCITARLKL